MLKSLTKLKKSPDSNDLFVDIEILEEALQRDIYSKDAAKSLKLIQVPSASKSVYNLLFQLHNLRPRLIN